MNAHHPEKLDIKGRLHHAIIHMEHRLTAQAPLKDFVHHNTLHAFQEHAFPEALGKAREQTGFHTFLPLNRYWEFFHQGRITREELLDVIRRDGDLDAETPVVDTVDLKLYKKDIIFCGLLHDFSPVSAAQLSWHIEEKEALLRFQTDVSQEARRKIIHDSGFLSESAAVTDLWSACLEALSLQYFNFHPEELLDLSADQAEAMVTTFANVRVQVRTEAETLLADLLQKIGREWTLRQFLLTLTGNDVLEEIQPLLVRQMANHMDLGVTAWHSRLFTEGFYSSWKEGAEEELAWVFDEMPDWGEQLQELPKNSLDAIVAELLALGLAEDLWPDYLERLCQEIPGWSGMFAWRQSHPGYGGSQAGFQLADYLAVRLILERLFARRLCLRTWKIAPNLFFLRWYFQNNTSELLVRYAIFNQSLPDSIISRAQWLLGQWGAPSSSIEDWQAVAHLIWTWRRSSSAGKAGQHSLFHSGWRLFRLTQHLGFSGSFLRTLPRAQVENMLACLDRLTLEKSGYLWLQAYEKHYRDPLFSAVAYNHGLGEWAVRAHRPEAQVVFCMDDREEGIRRHLEEHNPAIETLGAAGFFGVAINWTGLDDTVESALCPIIDRPSHKVREVIRSPDVSLKKDHDRRKTILARFGDTLFNKTRHSLGQGLATLAFMAPTVLLALTAKEIDPLGYGRLVRRFKERIVPPVETEITLTAPDDGTRASPEQNRSGFTDAEQAARVRNFLRNIGLTSGFAPLVVMMGHGSSSENNPHRAAYDCGACSGRHGGPNARVFAAMANRPEVRALLAQEGITIPGDTWFVGANHNTCDESFTWFDRSRVPASTIPILGRCIGDLEFAARMSAHERCRKVASSPDDPDPQSAIHHIRGRCLDIGQARPELGHATNAAAFVGRRSVSRGLFLDRRVFLISYNPESDPTGSLLEGILLNITPVGGGINLEYYFSTVNNERLGCGSKVTHNLTGFFGIMDGTESDLRTGLPFQMIEIHEAMRLQILIEAETHILTRIYQDRPLLQEWVGRGWVLLSAKNPHGPEIHVFEPDRGWVLWENKLPNLPIVDRSPAWYRGHRDHLGPARIQATRKVAR